MPFCVVFRMTELAPWSGHVRTNAVDLGYLLFFFSQSRVLQSKSYCFPHAIQMNRSAH